MPCPLGGRKIHRLTLSCFKDSSHVVRLAAVKCLAASCVVRPNPFRQTLKKSLQLLFSTDPHVKVAALACQELAKLEESAWPSAETVQASSFPRTIQMLRHTSRPATQASLLQLSRELSLTTDQANELCHLIIGHGGPPPPSSPSTKASPPLRTETNETRPEITPLPTPILFFDQKPELDTLCQLTASYFVRHDWTWWKTPDKYPEDIFKQLQSQYLGCGDLIRYQDRRVFAAIRSLIGIFAKRGVAKHLLTNLKSKVDTLSPLMGPRFASAGTSSLSQYF